MRKRNGFGRDRRSSASWVVAVALGASVVVMAADATSGGHAALGPVRDVTGSVLGPAEAGAAGAVRPLRDLRDYAHRNSTLRTDVARLTAQNDQLRHNAEQAPIDRQRLAEYEGLTKTASTTGYSLVATHVVGMGPMQSFSRTVTIDAGTSSGVHKDMTVLNSQGLVGRVIDATRSSATVLLILDTDSVVGGRLGSNMEIGFLRGRGVTGDRGRLDLDLVDTSVIPTNGDTVVTWGSRNGVPYVAGVPVGTVESVYSTPREMAKHAVIRPFVDFTALDLVGVVVPRNTHGDRTLIGPGGNR